MIISTKLTIIDLAEQKPMVIFLVSEACAVPLVSEVMCHSLNVNKALRSKTLFRATWKTSMKLDDPVHYQAALNKYACKIRPSCCFLSAHGDTFSMV